MVGRAWRLCGREEQSERHWAPLGLVARRERTVLSGSPSRAAIEPLVTAPSQTGGARRAHRDRVCIECVGLAVVAGVDQPIPGWQLGRHVEHLLTGRDQPLRQRTDGAVGALDCPRVLRLGLHVGPHRRVASLVGAKGVDGEVRLAATDQRVSRSGGTVAQHRLLSTRPGLTGEPSAEGAAAIPQ